ncbi:transposase [Streptomyces sp. RLB1-33]|nr:transposase [Streptomyces sp. RLB1-33]
MRDLLQRLIAAGQWQTGDPDILIVADAGYDAPRLGFLLKDLPVQVLPGCDPTASYAGLSPRLPQTQGRPPRHGGEFVFGQPDTWDTPDTETATDTPLYGQATARSWNRLHPKLTHHSSWAAADGTLPIVEGTVIRLDIAHLPSGATPQPGWLWWSGTDATPADADRLWQAYLRRFDIEHTFRLFKQTLGWTSPKIRTPRGGGPVDLADPRRLHPTAARPPAGSRPTTPLGETQFPGQTHSCPRPPRLPAHPPTSRLPGPSTETLPTRPRTTTRPKEHPTHTPPRRAHTPQNTAAEAENEEVNHPTTPPHRLKIKLGACLLGRVVS